MLAQLTTSSVVRNAMSASYLLVLLPKGKALPKDIPYGDLLAAVLKRRDMKADELAKSPVGANAADGALVAWAMLDLDKDTFAQQTQVRKALQLLLGEDPKTIAIAVLGDEAQRQRAAAAAQEKGRPAQAAAKHFAIWHGCRSGFSREEHSPASWFLR